jgi:hypothetical protein
MSQNPTIDGTANSEVGDALETKPASFVSLALTRSSLHSVAREEEHRPTRTVNVRQHIPCGDAKSSNKTIFTRWREKSQRQTLTIYSFGDIGLETLIADCPDFFQQPRCKLIKWERKIKVGHLPLQIGGTTRDVYVKQHCALSLGHRLGSLFALSAAMRSFAGATTLLEAGYSTAWPIAAVEYRSWGILTKSLYLSEGVSGAKTVEAFWCEDCVPLKGVEGYRKRRAFLRKLARLFQSLHRQNIYHNDLKASNILVVDESASSAELFHLIDLQGLKKCFYISRRRRIRNLAQLNRTLGAFMTATERLFFLDTYLDFHLPDQNNKKRLVESILERSRRQVERERQRTSASEESSQTAQIELDGRCITRAVFLDKTNAPR